MLGVNASAFLDEVEKRAVVNFGEFGKSFAHG
jgi:hypothetical protein